MRMFEITQPEQVMLRALATDIRGTQSYTQIKQLVMKHFPMITVDIHKSIKVDQGSMNIGAHYDPDKDEEGHLPIHIDLFFSNEDTNQLTWTRQGRKFFLYNLQDVMKHELLHMKQHRQRDFHPGKNGYDNRSMEYEYMSRPDEIEAYAMNIADELTRHVGNEGAFELLRMAKKTAQFKTEIGHFLSPNLTEVCIAVLFAKLLNSKKIYIYFNSLLMI